MFKRSLVILAALSLSLALTVIAVNNDLGLPEEFADYHQWYRANVDKSFIESAHPIMKDVYFNDTAAEGFENGEFSFPFEEGSIFVKESLDPDTLVVSVMTVMRKTNENDETGGWDWGMWERAGADDEHPENGNNGNENNDNPNQMGGFDGGWLPAEEAAQMCVECHSQAENQDYAFLDYLDRQGLERDNND